MERTCGRARADWRQMLGCTLIYLHRNGWHTKDPGELYATTRHQVAAAARARWTLPDGVVLFGADGYTKGVAWTPSDGEHVYAARPHELWMWPGRAPGFRTNISIGGRQVEMETLDLSPRLFRLRRFLTRKECNELRKAANAQGWEPSGSFDPDTGREYSLSDGRRRAHTAWVGTEYGLRRDDVVSNPLLERLQRRAADAARVHLGHAEPWQVVKYGANDYQYHHDDGLKTPVGSTRAVTVLVQMTTVPSARGGGTNFPTANGGDGTVASPGACTAGLTVQPRMGDALLFYNVEPPDTRHDERHDERREERHLDMVLDPRARHAACKLLSGEKLIANVWVHDIPVNESMSIHGSCDDFAERMGETKPTERGEGSQASEAEDEGEGERGEKWHWCVEAMRKQRNLVRVRGALRPRLIDVA